VFYDLVNSSLIFKWDYKSNVVSKEELSVDLNQYIVTDGWDEILRNSEKEECKIKIKMKSPMNSFPSS